MKWPWKRKSATITTRLPRLDKDALDTAVLSVLGPFTFRSSDTAVECGWIGQDTVDRERKLIAQYRDWMFTVELPSDVFGAYRKWLDYFELRCNEAQFAINTGAKERHDQQEQREAEERAKKDNVVSEILKDMPRLNVREIRR